MVESQSDQYLNTVVEEERSDLGSSHASHHKQHGAQIENGESDGIHQHSGNTTMERQNNTETGDTSGCHVDNSFDSSKYGYNNNNNQS